MPFQVSAGLFRRGQPPRLFLYDVTSIDHFNAGTPLRKFNVA